MSEDRSASLTSEEQRFLDQESFVTEALKRRERAAVQKPFWQRFLESPGGAAAASALLGGLFSLLVTLTVQNATRDRDFQEAQLKAQSEASLLERKEHIEQQRELIKRAYELVGSTAGAATDLIATASSDLNPQNFDSRGKDIIAKQREQVRARYNVVTGEWANEKGKVRALLSYFNDDPEVVLSWERLEDSVDTYKNCVAIAYEESHYQDEPISCKEQEDDVWKEVDNLNIHLAKTRQASMPAR